MDFVIEKDITGKRRSFTLPSNAQYPVGWKQARINRFRLGRQNLFSYCGALSLCQT
jgi:hypothetical protein